MAVLSLPSCLFATLIPITLPVLWKLLSIGHAEVNGNLITLSAESIFPSLQYITLLASAYIAGNTTNRFDFDFNRLLNRNNLAYYLVPPILFHMSLAFAGTLSAALLVTTSANASLNTSVLLLSVTEICLASVLGCSVGLAIANGTFSATTIFLTSVLVIPAFSRLFPSLEVRGLHSRFIEFKLSGFTLENIGIDILFYSLPAGILFAYYSLHLYKAHL